MAPAPGYWGKQTSTIDWCEDNYAISYYVAEFWNTLSNTAIIFSPLLMLVLAYKEQHEKKFVYIFASMTVVGIGSWLFHMTLQYSMQLMDELPMLWTSACFTYACLMMKSKIHEDSRGLQVALALMTCCVTLVYILIEVPVFLQIAYGLMSTLIIVAHIKIMFSMETHKKLFAAALGFYLLGFLFWNVDNVYCHHLRNLRKHNFSGMLFQCHAWWHIFTGVGAYMGILFSFHTRYTYLQKNPELKFFLGFWPYVSLSQAVDKIS